MTGLVKMAIGFAAGYSVMRVLECRAQGVPLSAAFQLDPKVLFTPVSQLGGFVLTPATRAPALAPPQGAVDPDAVIPPSFAR